MSKLAPAQTDYYWTDERKTRAAQEIVTGHMTVSQFSTVYRVAEAEVENWIVSFLNSRLGRLGLIPEVSIKTYQEQIVALREIINEQQRQIRHLLKKNDRKLRLVEAGKDASPVKPTPVPVLWRG